jgi:hypothetical protein
VKANDFLSIVLSGTCGIYNDLPRERILVREPRHSGGWEAVLCVAVTFGHVYLESLRCLLSSASLDAKLPRWGVGAPTRQEIRQGIELNLYRRSPQ